MRLKTLLVLALPLLVSGCGSSGSSNSNSDSTSPPGPLSGNWQMTFQSANTHLKPWSQSGFLLEQKNTISGGVILSPPGCAGLGNVIGSASGTAISITVSPVGLVVTETGTLGADQSSMSGTYTMLAAGCPSNVNDPQTGTWTANLVKPIQGNLQGTFQSTQPSAPPVTISGKVTQGKQTAGSSFAPLSGTLTATNYCFDTANYSGTISGTAVVMTLVNSDGSQLGQVSGSLSLDGTSLNGKFFILAQGPNGNKPCRSGDLGTATLTVGP
jgi:hypothetical protein